MDSAGNEAIARQIRTSYDAIGPRYRDWTQPRPSPREPYLAALLARLPGRGARVLELGCGPGEPVTAELVRRGVGVVANDLSEAQIGLARERCAAVVASSPASFELPEFVVGDMLALTFPEARFDGVVSFFALVHLPRMELATMLGKVAGWLDVGGWLVCNFGAAEDEGGWGKFLGEEMFWSGFGVERTLELMREAGFEMVKAEVLPSGENLDASDPDYGIEFLWVLARKKEVDQTGEKSR